MDQDPPNSPPVNFNALPDDSPHVNAAVAALRCRAVEENLEVRQFDLSDARLIQFLRCRDFDSNLAWKVFKNYHKWKRECPEIIGNLHPPSVLSLLKTGYIGILKGKDPTQWDPEIFTAYDLFRVSVMLCELMVREPDTQRNGVKTIFDLQGWKFAHAFQITPAVVRKIAFVLTIHLHGNNFTHGLQKHFPASLLPEEFNGEAGPFEEFSKDLIDLLMESTDYLQ
ncbi:hypothetical protein E2320_011419, partial [Naja naja]